MEARRENRKRGLLDLENSVLLLQRQSVKERKGRKSLSVGGRHNNTDATTACTQAYCTVIHNTVYVRYMQISLLPAADSRLSARFDLK